MPVIRHTSKLLLAVVGSLFYGDFSFAQIKDNCLVEILTKRYSGFSFDSTRYATKEQLDQLLEAARLAPSSYNEQPWYFIICDKKLTPTSYEKAFNALAPFNQGWAKDAPLLIIATASLHFTYNNKINPWSAYDTGAAALSLALQATSLGLMSHQIGGFCSEKIKKDFQIPEGFTPLAIIAIGYAAKNEPPPEKKRKTLSENFFLGTWGQGYK